MAMSMGSSAGIKSDINVTPLVDVMLVLLIIMMIVAPLLQQGVDLRLPVAANSAVKRLLGTPPETDLSAALRALYVTGLLAGRATPTPAQVATLGTSVLDMVEDLLSDGS